MIIYLFLLRRLRIWDYILSASDAPDREIVHSHDFNRYLTPFRAEWDPKDAAERTVIIGRYLTFAPFLFVLHFAHFSHCMPANLDTAACRMMRAYACVAAAARNSHHYRASYDLNRENGCGSPYSLIISIQGSLADCSVALSLTV